MHPSENGHKEHKRSLNDSQGIFHHEECEEHEGVKTWRVARWTSRKGAGIAKEGWIDEKMSRA